MLRAEFVPGREQRQPRQLTGADAANAPAGHVIDTDALQISKPPVTVHLALVELNDSVALDLVNGGERRARMFLPQLVPGGNPLDLKRATYKGEGFGEADVWWVNPNSGRLTFHYVVVYPANFEFSG